MADTPHTLSQQNRHFDRTDLEPDQLEQTAGTGEDSRNYENNEGAQTAGNRSPRSYPDSATRLNTEPTPVAEEGDLRTRTPEGSGQGISNHSSAEDNSRQKKVVSERPDAQAGVNRAS